MIRAAICLILVVLMASGEAQKGLPEPKMPEVLCRLAARAHPHYLRAMDQPDLNPQPGPAETAEERASRLAEENRLTEEAEEEAERDGTIPAEEVFAWLRSLDTDSPLPEPQPRKDDVWQQMNEARAADRAEVAKRQP
jgi:hypothetical protein